MTNNVAINDCVIHPVLGNGVVCGVLVESKQTLIDVFFDNINETKQLTLKNGSTSNLQLKIIRN